MSLKKRVVNSIKTPNIDIDEDKGPLCSIKFLQGEGESVCGGFAASGSKFCMTRLEDCTTVLHACQKGFTEELSGKEDGVWLLMEKPSPRLPASALLQPSLGAPRSEKALGFEDLPIK